MNVVSGAFMEGRKMPEQTIEKVKPKIVIPDEGDEFQVPGFSEAYEAFIGEDPSRRVEPNWPAFALCMVGGIMAFVGAWNLLVQPLSIENKALSSIGALIMLAAVKISRDAAGVSPRDYLALEYELLDDEGPLSEGYAPVKYLGEGRFRVKY